MPRRMGSKKRILKFLCANVGKTVTAEEVQQAAGPVTEWARRLRELRAEGWRISSHRDRHDLRPGDHVLESALSMSPGYAFSKPVSMGLRAEVLERDGYTCQMCGAGAGDDDENNPGRKVRLHIGHIIDRSRGGKNVLSNLRALCSTCNQGAQDLAPEPPAGTWLLAQVRRATIKDQRKVLDWLLKKFDL